MHSAEPYAREPLRFLGEIPVFSVSDFYVQNYEKISQDHLDHFQETGSNPFMSEEYWSEIENSTRDLLKKYCGEGGLKILDVGVGTGRLLEQFHGHERFGMDISSTYLKLAESKGIKVCLSLIEDMPYRAGYFDAVVCTDVLEHVFDLNQDFKKILSVLKPGGILICRVPYRENLAEYLEPSFPYDLVHLRNFDEHSIRLFVEKIFNLRVVEWNVSGFWSGPVRLSLPIPYVRGAATRLVRSLKMFGAGFYRRVARHANHPTVINFVVRNDVSVSR
jgi:SAM-dependent methyltransferase